MPRVRRAVLAAALLAAACARPAAHPVAVATHDNTHPAGALAHDTLRVTLVTREGWWTAGMPHDSGAVVWTLTLPDSAPLIPAPLLRVPAGTALAVTLRNTRHDSTLRVHGLVTHPAADSVVTVAPGAERTVTFAAGAPGTYYYWAAFSDGPLADRPADESQLAGAFVIDSTATPPADHIYLLGIWNIPPDSSLGPPVVERFVSTINGRAFPHTTPLAAEQGDTVRWRWINPTPDSHPIHLHGFFFDVVHRGGATVDSAIAPEAVVTQMMPVGGTFDGRWIASEPGNWVAHCHFTYHVSHYVSFNRVPDPTDAGGPDETHSGSHKMRGMVIPITVTPKPGMATRAAESPANARAIRLEARSLPGVYGKYEGVAYVADGDTTPRSALPIPSTPLILRRGEPVRITIVNRSRAATAVHWHGLEVPSYPDGVPGWSGVGPSLAPPIMPGDSFVAAFTPPRAGTFMYHAHSNETFQIASGMYGALLVVDPATYRPDHERLVIAGGDGLDFRHGRVNGKVRPDTLTIVAGEPYRFRLIHINVDWQLRYVLRRGGDLLTWTPIAKDGADLPAARRREEPATWHADPGETRDVLVRAAAPGMLHLEVRTVSDDGWQIVVPIRVVAK